MLDYRRDILPYLEQGAAGTAPGSGLLHAFYGQSVAHKNEIKEVFGKTFPTYLDVTRPNERKVHKEYRKTLFEKQGNPFRGIKSRVIDVLDYIRQADDFAVKFPTTEIREEINLQTYSSRSTFSVDGDAVRWFFQRIAPDYVNDPNAVFLTLPERAPISELEYPEPKFWLIPCENVWAHRKGKFAALLSPEKNWIATPEGLKLEGITIYFVDHDSYSIARQVKRFTNDQGNKQSQWEVLGLEPVFNDEGAEVGKAFFPPLHYCETMPAVRIGKKVAERNDKGEELYESILADALPYIRKSHQRDSDIEIETNFHISSQEWRKAQRKCQNAKCKDGLIIERTPATEDEPGGHIKNVTACPTCKGTHFDISGSGMDIYWVAGAEQEGFNNPNGGKVSPGAPGGFIPRNIEPLTKLVEELKRDTEEAYACLNMQFIRNTPYDQSGLSKRYDREELYRELNTQAGHLLELLEEGYRWLDSIRFGPSGRAGEQVPEVLVPVRFNLENAELTREELNDAKVKKYDSALVESYELKMLQYTVGEQSDAYRRYVLRMQLDPFKNMNYQEKLLQTNEIFVKTSPGEARTLAMERLYFSINFDGLVTEALIDDPDFWLKEIKEQRAILMGANKKLVGEIREEQLAKEQLPQSNQIVAQPGVDLQNANQTVGMD
ncbi:hypothetical protein [Tellurirhabdus bombi]|uniref:hypothetical protein n=1 Tax=Tellurirhabdus bombi TaxID=2907205 RepID=UPI001F28C707|nr:hypothetical protein [Tellurirhabdus bombi]